jgi:hypothetical protein
VRDLLAAGTSASMISQTLSLDRSPALRTTREQVAEFAQSLTQRRGHDLQDWMRRDAARGAPAVRSFDTGLERDLDAVTAG